MTPLSPDVRTLLARAEDAEHRAARLAAMAGNTDPRPPMPPTPADVADMDDVWCEAVEAAMPPFVQAQAAVLAVLEAHAARALASDLNRANHTRKAHQ